MPEQAQKPPKTNKETERWVKDFLDDTYREEGSAATRFANSKRVRELVMRAERLLVKVGTPDILSLACFSDVHIC